MKALLTIVVVIVCGFIVNAVALSLIAPIGTVTVPPDAVIYAVAFMLAVGGMTLWGALSYFREHGAWWMLLAGPLAALLFGLFLFGAMRTHNTVLKPCYTDCPPAPW